MGSSFRCTTGVSEWFMDMFLGMTAGVLAWLSSLAHAEPSRPQPELRAPTVTRVIGLLGRLIPFRG